MPMARNDAQPPKKQCPQCSECPPDITLSEAYEGSLYCKAVIQAGKCPKFEYPSA